MKFSFLFKSTAEATVVAERLWPTCFGNIRTLSFRVDAGDDLCKITDSDYLDGDGEFCEEKCSSDSVFSAWKSEICNSFDEHPEGLESAVVGGLKSERLFFEPGETNSILEEAKAHDDCNHDGGVAVVAMESDDPCSDFRISMEEMVVAHGWKDWEHLEELLAWYLRINCEINHGYIVEAFLDLLIDLGMLSAIEDLFSSSPSPSSNTALISFTSPLSFSSSSSSNCSSATAGENEEEDRILGKIGESCSSTSSVSSYV